MKVIGITGGIGSGKSLVSEYLRSKGYDVIDADHIAGELAASPEVLSEIKDKFGHSFILEDGSLDRKKMADVVFADPEKKALLESIVTKRVIERIEEILEAKRKESGSAPKQGCAPEELVFLDAPTLYETGAERLCDEVWAVIADRSVRIDRVKERDGSGESEIEARMDAQLSDESLKEKADVTIMNDGSIEELQGKIEMLL